jgi:hypothetical protein
MLGLDENKRGRTIRRFDAGGGSLGEINWRLERGYQIHGKDFSSVRATAWAATVKEWFDDPQRSGRQVGWVEPATTADYGRSVRRLAIRCKKKNGHYG